MSFAIEIETIHVTEVIRSEDILLPLLIIKSAGIETTLLGGRWEVNEEGNKKTNSGRGERGTETDAILGSWVLNLGELQTNSPYW